MVKKMNKIIRDNKGRFVKGTKPLNSFKKGHKTWNKGLTYMPKNIEQFIENGKKTRFKKGNIPFFKGKHLPKEVKRKLSNSLKGRKTWNKGKNLSKEYREKLSKARLKGLKEGRIKVWNRGLKNKNFGKEARQILKEKMRSPKFKEKWLRNLLKGLLKRPTTFEQKIIELIKEHNLPFKYVGNGKVIICFRNPDFIECNGRKLLIETYYSYWHSKNYEKQRARIFSKYGYKTLFLNENDLLRKNWKEVCLNKINNFMVS